MDKNNKNKKCKWRNEHETKLTNYFIEDSVNVALSSKQKRIV